MADINSTQIANGQARPYIQNAAQVAGGRLRTKAAVIELDGTQSGTDVMRFFSVKSNDRVTSLQLSCDALTGLTSVDFGIHLKDGGAAVDDDVFDAAQTLAVALVRQEKRVGADSALNIDTLDKQVWQLLGLTSDPNVTYEVTGTINTAGSASGTVMLEMTYTAGD